MIKSIGDLVREKAKEENIQIRLARPMIPDDIEWLRVKQFIDSLSGIYEEFIKEALEKNAWKIKIATFSKNTEIIELEKYIFHNWKCSDKEEFKFGYRIVIEIVEIDRIVKKATYYAFRHIPAISYIREIIKVIS